VTAKTAEQRAAERHETEWRKLTSEAAYERVRLALERSNVSTSDNGGLVALIPDPDGNAIWYYVRLTEVRP
jgi:hypothetical protein